MWCVRVCVCVWYVCWVCIYTVGICLSVYVVSMCECMYMCVVGMCMCACVVSMCECMYVCVVLLI